MCGPRLTVGSYAYLSANPMTWLSSYLLFLSKEYLSIGLIFNFTPVK